MAVKVYVLLVALVFAGAVAPVAHAQLSGPGGLGGLLGGILGNLVNIVGIVHCSVGGPVNLSTSNPFPNATVQLNCGGNTVATTTTNSNGQFQFITGLLGTILSVLNGCNVAVTTPLASCNASLPSAGTLFAPLTQVAGSNNLVPGVFTLLN